MVYCGAGGKNTTLQDDQSCVCGIGKNTHHTDKHPGHCCSDKGWFGIGGDCDGLVSCKNGQPASVKDDSHLICVPNMTDAFFHTTYADNLSITGMKPTSQPNNACYIYTLGTGQSVEKIVDGKYESGETYPNDFMKHMASKGFCAATVEYPDHTLLEYPEGHFDDKSKEIYDKNIEHSAVNALNKIGCDCSSGIIAHGFSQGAHIAALSHNHNDDVKGVLMFSGGCDAGVYNFCDRLQLTDEYKYCNQGKEGKKECHKFKDKEACDAHAPDGVNCEPSGLTIKKENIRDISAQQDGTLGCGFMDPSMKTLYQIQNTTGTVCDEPHCNTSNACDCEIEHSDCFTSDGGGYYILPHDEYDRDHQWFIQPSVQDAPWKLWDTATTTDKAFNIYSNLDWLASKVNEYND